MLELLGSFALMLVAGMPVSFCLVISSLFYLTINDISPIIAIQRVAMSIGDSFTLLSVPLFVLAGCIMNSGGITERIFGFANKLVGHITGGLGHANILASIIFSGMSGTAIADTGGLGAIELKAMKDAGYDEDFSLAVTGASSIIGPIIPPSVPAVLFGVIAGVSVGKLFIAGIVPGLFMGLMMSAFVYIQSKRKGYKKTERARVKEILQAFRKSFFAILTPAIIIGGMLGGMFTPTEAAVIAVAYALVLSFVYKEIKLKDIPRLLKETGNNTVSVMLIVAGASIFGWILTIEQVPQKITYLFINNIDNQVVALLFINLLLLMVGMFMETISAITILTPVLLPVVITFGIDPIHFGIIMILNLMIGLLTPPVGMVLYVLSAVSNVPFEKIVKAIWPYIIVLSIVLMIITFVPEIVLMLPGLLGM
ncbi:TRAP transporter large permease [Geosporobacter ferrireducens]|uniref:ABC transporter permease n=1 Tax=Geosporobacter ferrireducens TaxID=1424294 RepID=A0A1D8GM96_9FIRM|nr:TRAP transporter large permease [Geosporobacter ferrireducens]AOT72031.1 ABC transporter permease [Geosporobacter ferrireducens]MTI55911.1 TRAP transporter large permease [Geosporobacter ferrireducens]